MGVVMLPLDILLGHEFLLAESEGVLKGLEVGIYLGIELLQVLDRTDILRKTGKLVILCGEQLL